MVLPSRYKASVSISDTWEMVALIKDLPLTLTEEQRMFYWRAVLFVAGLFPVKPDGFDTYLYERVEEAIKLWLEAQKEYERQ